MQLGVAPQNLIPAPVSKLGGILVGTGLGYLFSKNIRDQYQTILTQISNTLIVITMIMCKIRIQNKNFQCF